MYRSVRDIKRASAALLLVVFVLGGLVSPVVHRAVHSVENAVVRLESKQKCDHSLHGDAFEVDRPKPPEEDCLLCVRQLVSLAGLDLAFTAYRESDPYRFSQRPSPDGLRYSLTPIRGPPYAA